MKTTKSLSSLSVSIRRALLVGALGAFALFSGQSARATVYTWDGAGTKTTAGSGGSGAWDTSTKNWNSGTAGTDVVYVTSPSASAVVFAGGTNGTQGQWAINTPNNLSALRIQFNNSGYELTGPGHVNLGAGGVLVAPGVVADFGSGFVVSSSTWVIGAGTTDTGTLNIDSGAAMNNSGTSIAIQGTTVNVNSGGILAGTGANTAITLSSAATVNVAGGTLTATGTGAINVGDGSTGGTLTVTSGLVTTGAVVLGAGSATDTINFNGGTLQANASSTTFFSASANTNAAAKVQAGGAVIDTNSFNITIAQPLIHDSALGATADGGLTKLSAGTLTLTGANTYTGATTINAGTLSVATLGNVASHPSSNLGSPTTSANGTISIGSTTTAATLVDTGTGETTDRVINLAGTTGGATLDQSGTGLLKFTSAFTATGVGAKTLTLQGSTAGTGEIDGAIVDSSSGATSLTKAGTDTWTLAGANTYTGATTVNGGGTLRAGVASVAGVSGAFGKNSAVSLDNTAGTTLDLNGFNTQIGSLAGGGSTGGTVSLGSKTLTINGNASTNFGGVISGTSSSSLVINAGGTLQLSGSNTFSGTTALTNSSIINYASASAIGSTSAITVDFTSQVQLNGIGSSGSSAQTLTLNGGLQVNGGLVSVSGTNNLADTINVAVNNSEIFANGGTFTLSGPIQSSAASGTQTLKLMGNSTGTIGGIIGNGGTGGTIGLTESASGGTWILGNANTFSGATLISAGTMQLNNANALQNSTVTVSATNGLTFSNSLSGGSTYNLGALAGASNEKLADTGNNAVTVVAGSNGATTTYSGSLSGSGGLTKTGTGTLTLSKSTGSTYSGATTVSGGTLVVTNTGGTATGSGALSVGAGAALAGTGTSSGSSFSISGTDATHLASVYVGQSGPTGDNNTTSNLTLEGAGTFANAGTTSTIANANLTFNLDTTSVAGSPGAGNELVVGSTGIAFGSNVTLTLNLQGNQNVTASVPYFVLIAGTTNTGGGGQLGSQYSGLNLAGTSISADGGTLTQILGSTVGGGGDLQLVLNLNGSTSFYNGQAGLYLFQSAANGGIDDIVVVPEPGTWAMMLGGLAVLIFWQRRKNKQS